MLLYSAHLAGKGTTGAGRNSENIKNYHKTGAASSIYLPVMERLNADSRHFRLGMATE